MKRLHSFAVLALAAPALTLFSSATLADGSAGDDMELDEQSVQYEEGTTLSASQTQRSSETESSMPSLGYMSSAPVEGLHAGELIGTQVLAAGDEEVGAVSDLIINESGQIVAIVVGVGGFLGMGEKDVAIGWDAVSRSGESDALELRIDQTREELTSAPEFTGRE